MYRNQDSSVMKQNCYRKQSGYYLKMYKIIKNINSTFYIIKLNMNHPQMDYPIPIKNIIL